jgi:predicted DNA-binding helix-hairpin-helix protein
MDDLRAQMQNLKHSIRQTVQDAIKASDGDPGNVNVASRKNIVVARNIGSDGSRQHVTARQDVHVSQDGTVTHEESVTTTGTGLEGGN